MRISITLSVDIGGKDPDPEREASADALVERADASMPPLGFVPNPHEPVYRRGGGS